MDSDRIEHHRRLFAYDAWANREAVAAVRAAGDPPLKRALRLLAHVVGCERLWLERLEGRREPPPVWPDLDLTECEAGIEELAGQWADYLDGLARPAGIPGTPETPETPETTAGRLGERVDYVNSQGEAWTGTVEEILTHTILHSVYHRGQIATELRAAGHQSAYTDYIHAVRRGLVE